MRFWIVLVFVLILISSISFALESGKLYINDVFIPYEISDFDEALEDLEESFEEEEPTIKAKSISYVYVNGQRIAKVENNEVYYFHNDHLGSPRVITDINGKVIERINYMPFGEEINGESKIGYNSKELDKDTSLHYYGARYYSSPTGRFITADTVKGSLADPQSLNLYVYVKNNPMKYVDPDGRQALEKIKNFFGVYTEPARNKEICTLAVCAMRSFYSEEVENIMKKVDYEVSSYISDEGYWRDMDNEIKLRSFGFQEYINEVAAHETAHIIYGEHTLNNPIVKFLKYSIYDKIVRVNELALMNHKDREQFMKDMGNFLDFDYEGIDTKKKEFQNFISRKLRGYAKSKREQEWFAYTAQYIFKLEQEGEDPHQHIPENILKYYREFIPSLSHTENKK